jgi:ATP-dependent Lon protease
MEHKKNKIFSLVPLRDIVLFPKMIAPLFVGRAKSIKSIERIDYSKDELLLVTQKESSATEPKIEELYDVGVLAKIIQTLKLPDGTLKILVEVTSKVKIIKVIENEGCFQGITEQINDVEKKDVATKALMKSVIAKFQDYAKYNPRINHEIFNVLDDIKEAGHLADIITANITATNEKKQELLEINGVKLRLKKLLFEIEYEISLLQAEQKIRENVKKQMEKTQKDYFLNEQLKVIHKELGGTKGGKSEINILENKIKTTKLSKEAKEKAEAELHKLKMTNSISAEATIIRNYLDYLLSLPWGKTTKVTTDIERAERILNRDHYGLKKIKERILEFLAVQKRTKFNKGPIICFVGPPGVGKTSLAKSIAEATSRNFVKFSLGGIRDEAEIRGHRKTYLGSMPGKIMYLLKKAKSSNPVMLLDEIDRLGMDYRGDPAAALLEVLDPEQNKKFVDHYLEVEYDLSHTIFIATANSTEMHRALLDRMEIITLSGYTEDEKLEIAKRHLIKKQKKEHKLSTAEFTISDDAIINIIRYYTKEAGVRSLEREIAKLARKTVRQLEQNKKTSISITVHNLEKYLGVKKFSFGESEKEDQVGVTTGLAYTQAGGDLLSIEAALIPGKGMIKSTGKLGEVMQESVQAALSYFKSNSIKYGVIPPKFYKKDIHIHVPEGATPKDGPSAGIAILTSIVSVMTGIPVDRTVAMTGEITLRGRVLPIGGLKEKLLAANRGGIKTVLIPEENKKDLAEIPKNIIKSLKIIPVKTADEAVKCALINTFSSVKWSQNEDFSQILLENPENSIVTN